MGKLLSDLDWFRVTVLTLIGTGGGFGLFKAARLANRDFLGPYRSEVQQLRERADELERKADEQVAAAAQTRRDLYDCQEREERLRLDLIRAGVNIPPPTPHPPEPSPP